MRKQEGKVSSALLFVVVVVIVGGLLGGAGYWYGKKNSGKSTQNATQSDKKVANADSKSGNAQQTDTAKPCASSVDAKTFSSKLIGLEFCYPKEWGEATIGNVPASASNAGSAYEITFTKNSRVTVASATGEYVNTIGRGGRCADPVTSEPDFSGFSTAWKVEGALGDIQSASRDTIKKDGVYHARESVNDFGGNVCLTGYVNVVGGAYTLITVNLQAPYGSGITTVSAHVSNSDILITPAERVQFGELVESMKKAS